MAVPVWVVPLIYVGGAIVKNLIAGKSADDSMDSIQGGFDNASSTIRAGADKAWQNLDPYLKGGRQDYDRYRSLSNSGYYDTPYSGSFQPQGFDNQAIDPSQFNPATQSYESSYQPMQFRPMGLLSSPSLPTAPPMAPEPPPLIPMTRPNATLTPQVGPTIEGIQRGMDGVRSNTLGPTAPPLPNKNQVPNPFLDAVMPPGARLPTQPLTLQERMEIMRQGGSGPYVPYGYSSGGLLGRAR